MADMTIAGLAREGGVGVETVRYYQRRGLLETPARPTGYGTDGGIAPSGLVVLGDDKNVQPVYAPAPIIREAALKENPKIADALKPVFESLDLTTLQNLNARVQVGGEAAKAVATDYLKSKGFLK